MTRFKPLRTFGLVVLLASSTPALAASTGGCESFEFPLATELAWMTAPESDAATSGAKLDALPAKAIALTLVPTAQAKFEVPPTGKPKNKPEASHAALVTVSGVSEPGIYQISLSGQGWVDLVQNGVALKSVAHTGKSDCEGLRKSVRFEVASGPFTIQLSDVPTAQIRMTIRKAD
jgi:hypothetical protein